MAFTSMALGIISLFTYCFGIVIGIVAIILALIARQGMARSGNYAGKGMAMAGLVMGILAAVGWTLIYVIGIVAFMRSPHTWLG
jgi:hypothetical protein